MKDLNHPNVLNMHGVCIDGGPAPFIVMPFMANGSLRAYLKKEQPNLIVPEDADFSLVSDKSVAHTPYLTSTHCSFVVSSIHNGMVLMLLSLWLQL